MKKLLILFTFIGLISCGEKNLYNSELLEYNNSKNIFGVEFPVNQNWISTTNMSLNIDIKDYKQVLILASFNDNTLKILNSTQESGTVYFDVPDNCINLYIAYIDKSGKFLYNKLDTKQTRAYSIPNDILIINGTVETFANKRGWLPGEIFYTFDNQPINLDDYDLEFKTLFRDIIFNYFPNGRKYNNLPKIKKSGYYNESSYPITTGDEPIIVSPVYKNDGGYYEIAYSELYYYYFKGDLTTQEIEALSKYKAIQLDDIYTNEENDTIYKSKSYMLAYFNGEEGSYQFPKGYKIGFCYKSNTEYQKPNKQGELYGDGRLNYNINNWGNFKSSKLDPTEPRMAWMSVNDKMFLCIESGTDSDFNDLICEVEGGIEPIIIPDEPEYQSYMFCFEDSKLGDYDINDVVLKGVRLDNTHVEWTLMATGAMDDLYIYNIEGKHINSNNEVHSIFNIPPKTFINTQIGDNIPFVKDTIIVSKDFSFLINQPYIYNKTRNWNIKISRRGENPNAIMIPYDFKWPLEKICVKDAYLKFNEWGLGLIESTNWFEYPELDKIYNF